MKFGIVEVGSTVTKSYLFDNDNIKDLGSKCIPFKTNYKLNNKILDDDINSLNDFISELRKEVEYIYVFGTSIFRNISNKELVSFKERLKDGIFRVVSANEENLYTVKGVLANNDYTGDMVVAIGGGGSTEIAFVQNKKIVKMTNLNFGAIDITEKFPELKENKVKASFDQIFNYTYDLVGALDFNADVMVLAGGNYIYFYETCNYEMQSNTLYSDENQKYMLDIKTANKYDRDILNESLDDIKEKCPDNTAWWDGARGMRFCMNAIANKTGAKYIIPTKINMLLGLINEIKEKRSMFQ